MTWILESKDSSSNVPSWNVDLKAILREKRENVMKKKIALIKQGKSGENPGSKFITIEAIVTNQL